MKLKNILLSALSLVLVAALSIGGTVAYLQDDDSDVNVMTLGNVSIAQHEYERAIDAEGNYETIYAKERGENGYKLTEFTQAKPLYPATGAVTGWDDMGVCFEQLDGNKLGRMQVLKGLNNVQDKFVFVENTGKTDAYVRTLIAFEVGSMTNALTDDYICTSTHNYWTSNDVGIVEIDGNNYHVIEFVYDGTEGANAKHPDGIVHPGEFTYNNLAQVYMANKATNEDVEAIDGNDNGTYDILVLSQAVQAAGFDNAQTALDTAFGKSSEKAAEWFGGVKVPTVASSADALSQAIAEGGNVLLTEDVDMGAASVTITEDTTIDLNGSALTADRGAADVSDRASYAVVYVDGADVVLTGDGDVVNSAEDGAYCVYVDNGATVTITGGNYITYHDAVYVRDGKLIITGGFFQAKGDTKATADYIHPSYPDEPASFTAEVINCNKDAYINFKEGTSYSEGITAEVVITGGTFVNEDPSNIFEGWYTNQSYVPEGYKVIAEEQANGDIWYTVVAE